MFNPVGFGNMLALAQDSDIIPGRYNSTFRRTCIIWGFSKIIRLTRDSDFEICNLWYDNYSIRGPNFPTRRGSKSYSNRACLIATATYGSELAEQVQMLREIRDNTILNTASGSTFMTGFNQFYYFFSPTIADYERENPIFKESVKLAITPLLTTLSIFNFVDINSEEEMLGYGIGIIFLNLGMYFVVPTIAAVKIRNFYRKIAIKHNLHIS